MWVCVCVHRELKQFFTTSANNYYFVKLYTVRDLKLSLTLHCEMAVVVPMTLQLGETNQAPPLTTNNLDSGRTRRNKIVQTQVKLIP